MRKIFLITLFFLTSFSVGSADLQLFLVIDHHFESRVGGSRWVENSTEKKSDFKTYYRAGRLHIVSLVSNKKVNASLIGLRPIMKGEFSVGRPPQNKTLPHNQQVEEFLEDVNLDFFSEYVATLTGFENRSIRGLRRTEDSGNQKTQTWLVEQLQKYGLEVQKKCYFDWKFAQECNILAVHRGESPKVILVQAHMDDVGYSQAGADDNASGTAALLIMARELSQRKYKKTLQFLFTNGEEVGLNGSRAYVKELKSKGELENVEWTINMDMVAYNKNGIFEIETNQEFREQAEWYAQMAHAYTNLQPEITIPAWGSDHETFLREGIASFLTIEDWQTKTPCYHRACDKPETLNIGYAKQIIRLNLAVVAEQAQIMKIN